MARPKLKLTAKRRFIVKKDLAKRFWENNKPEATEIATKYDVSISTAYRWISHWEEDTN